MKFFKYHNIDVLVGQPAAKSMCKSLQGQQMVLTVPLTGLKNDTDHIQAHSAYKMVKNPAPLTQEGPHRKRIMRQNESKSFTQPWKLTGSRWALLCGFTSLICCCGCSTRFIPFEKKSPIFCLV